MRVMLFSDTYRPQVNGVATSVSTLAQSLTEQGHVVMVCAIIPKGGVSAPDTSPFPVVRAPGVAFPLYGDVRLANPRGLAFTQVVRRFAPDVIHCHTPFGIGWQGARAAHLCGIPLIGTHHTLFGDYIAAYSKLGRQVNQRLATLARRYIARFYNHCDLISCASRFLASDLIAGGMTRPIVIVPNPINTARFRPLSSTEGRQANTDPFRLIYFGRLAPEKNLRQLVLLVEPVLRRYGFANLEIVGDGPARADLEAFVQQRGLEGRICFAGWLHGDALVQRVASSVVCVSASLTENQPMSLLESLACGVPVVALAAAGVPEIIEDGRNGFLIDPADTSGKFARRIGQLLLDTDRHETMSQAAYSSAQRYSREAALQATLYSYEQALEAAALRRGVIPKTGWSKGKRLARLLPRRARASKSTTMLAEHNTGNDVSVGG